MTLAESFLLVMIVAADSGAFKQRRGMAGQAVRPIARSPAMSARLSNGSHRGTNKPLLTAPRLACKFTQLMSS